MGKNEEVTDYQLCKLAGHSGQKAAEIVLDAQRGDELALAWLRGLRARSQEK